MLRVCDRHQIVGRAVEYAELGSLTGSAFSEDHADQVLVLRLLNFHIDLDLLVELILSFEDCDHRVVKETTLEVSLAASLLHQK